MNILFIDSATEACTAAVYCDGEVLSSFEFSPRGHAQRLLPMAEALLAEAGIHYAQLDLIGFGRGPGSFAGVRIAVACAQGIALGVDLPMVGVSSLATLAQGQVRQLHEHGLTVPVHAAIDARMGEVYHGAFLVCDAGVVVAHGTEQVLPPNALWQRADWIGGVATGTGFGRYPELLQRGDWPIAAPDALPHARDGVLLAAMVPSSDWVAPTAASPVYLRDNVANAAG